MMGGKNLLVKAMIKTVPGRGGTISIHAMAVIEVSGPGMASRPRRFKIYSSGALEVSPGDFARKIELEQLEELKHYLSLLNVDLSEFDSKINP